MSTKRINKRVRNEKTNRGKVPVSNTDGSNTSYYDFEWFLRTYAAQNKVILRDLTSNRQNNPTYSRYQKSDVVNYLSNPASNEKALRDMSIYLYNSSNYYRRLIQYFSNMATFAFTISPIKFDMSKPVNESKFLKAYSNANNLLTIMNIPHEFTQILEVAYRDDVYYGLTWETKDSFMFQKLDPTYCKISSKEDGVYNFAFDFSYFDSHSEELPNYLPEFATMYNTYKSHGSSLRWQEIDPKKSICIKINESDLIPIPPFVSLFSALADIEDYRAIAKNASETNNYKMISLRIPIDEKTGNFLIDGNLAKDFYKQLLNVLPENIGAIMTPMEVDDWDFNNAGGMTDSDIVAKAESSLWAQAGVNKLLFGGGDDPSASTLALSTINDQAIVFRVLRQIERWINRKLKWLSGTYKFRINILDVTRYNQKEMHDQYIKDGQYGLPSRSAIMATSGLQSTDLKGMEYLENVILNLSEYEVPLKSSNVQSSESADVGRPKLDDTALTDAGEQSREQDIVSDS